MTPQTEPLRAALIGCGRIGANTSEQLRRALPPGWIPLSHAEALASLDPFELVAVCDEDEQTARQASVAFGIRHVFKDAGALIDCIQPDVISIATRTAGRCDLIKFAADAGVKGIHAEKPIARSLAECRRALDAVRKNKVKITYGTTRRWMDIFRKAKLLLDEGFIGSLVNVKVGFRRSPILWTHPHSMDLLLYFNGSNEIESIQASCFDCSQAQSGIIINSDPIVNHVEIHFANGASGSIVTTEDESVVLTGTEGTLAIRGNGAVLQIEASSTVAAGTPPKALPVASTMSGTQRALLSLAHAIRHNDFPGILVDDIERGCEMLLGSVLSSLQGGRKIHPSEIPEELFISGRTGDIYA